MCYICNEPIKVNPGKPGDTKPQAYIIQYLKGPSETSGQLKTIGQVDGNMAAGLPKHGG